MSLLKITTVEGRSSVEAVGYLGSKWGQYQLACTAAAAKWNRQRGDSSRNVCPSDSLPSLVSSLKGAGFDVELCEASKAILEGAAATGLTPAEEVASRHVEAMEAEYRTRGLSLWKPFQTDGAIFLAARKRALMGDEMGCVDGGATVRISRAEKGFALTLAQLYDRFHGIGPKTGQKWDLSIPTYIRSLCGGEFRLNPVKDVLDKGLKPTLEILLEDGKKLRLTNDHEVRLSSGAYVEAHNLRTFDEVTVNGMAVCLTCGGDKDIVTYKLAKFIGHCKRCVYRKHRAKPTWVGGKSIDGDGYVRVSGQWDHPRHHGGAVYEHVLVMEKHLGRSIGVDEAVHHKNENKQDNRVENLEVKSIVDHATDHGRDGGYLRMNGGRGSKGGEVCFVPKKSRVVSVRPAGLVHVYDVVCADPHRNFVANGIVVHNCGKTMQILTAVPKNGAAMVLCPASVVINWAREARKWRPDLIAIVVMKSPSRRTEDALGAEGIRVATECAWPMPGSITVVNYESSPCASDVYENVNAFDYATGRMVSVRTLRIERTLEGDPVVGTVLIGDELHRCKNKNAKMTAKWQTLRVAITAAGGSVYGATGTPIYNKPTDLAQILKNLNCFDDVFISWKDFKSRTGGFDNQWGTDWTGVIDPSVAQSLRRVMIRREKKDVMKSLPPKTYKDVYVEPSEALRKALDEIEKRLKGTKLDEEMARLRELQAMLQRQPDDYQELASEYEGLRGSALNSITNSIPFEDMSRIHSMMSEVGYAGAVDMIEDYEEANEPIVVFCPHRAPVERLGQRDGWRTILGGEDKSDRDQTVTYFQAGGCPGVAATIKAGGIGITLNRAKTVIFLGLDWSPAENWQAEDRVHRGEQRAHVLIIRIMPNHVFVRRLMELITIKTQTHEDAISAASVVGEMADERKEAAQKALAAIKAEQEMADMADAARSSGTAASASVGHLLDLIPSGRYALDSVPDATGATHTVFWQLDKPEAGRWARWAFLKVQRGPETGRFSTIRPDRMATAKCASVLERLAKDPRIAAIRYGQEIGECAICGRALTEEGSREAGIGPICARKVGW